MPIRLLPYATIIGCANSLTIFFSNDKDIEVAGLVPSLDPYYEKASCVIIPIFHLSGIKIKLEL